MKNHRNAQMYVPPGRFENRSYCFDGHEARMAAHERRIREGMREHADEMERLTTIPRKDATDGQEAET